MNKLKQTSESVYKAEETTRKYQELSYITLLGYNVLNLNNGIIMCLARPNEPSRYFGTILDEIRTKLFYRNGNLSYYTNAYSLLFKDKMEELEVKFKCFIKDTYLTDCEKEYKFLTDYKNNIKKYFNEYEKVAKTKFGNDYKVNSGAFFIRYCAICYALYCFDKKLYKKAIEHSDNEMAYYSRVIQNKYLKEARKDINNMPMASTEIDLIKDDYQTRIFETRYISYAEERLAEGVLIGMLQDEETKQDSTENNL